MYDEIQRRVNALRAAQPTSFSAPASAMYFDIPDAHAVSVVVSHEGIPLSRVKIGPHDIHGVSTQVNQDPLDRYRTAIQHLVRLL